MDLTELSNHAIALVALTAMEIVLGIDNIVFIATLTGRLPKERQASARRLGLGLALVSRILLLLTITLILKLKDPIFALSSLGLQGDWLTDEVNEVSVKDLILLVGGLFLIRESVVEIHKKIEGEEEGPAAGQGVSFVGVLARIAVMDIIFSLDSVITAVGMAESILIMVVAVILAVVVMLIFSEKVSWFVEKNPTVKMLALSFLILIGVMLVADAIGTPISKGYIYFAMAFALLVEAFNLRMRAKKAKQRAKRRTT